MPAGRKRSGKVRRDERRGDEGGGDARTPDRVPVWIVVSVLAIPLLLVLVYALSADGLHKGASVGPVAGNAAPAAQAPGQAQGAPQGEGQPDVTAMADRLAARLQSEPNDPNGWNTLAHTYYVLQRFPEAVKAYERLMTIAKPDASTLADYADALAMAQGRRLAGKPMELVRQAIALDPSQWKAQSMAATDAFERKDYAQAISHWERALAGVPPGSELARALEGNIAEARQLNAGK
jgi:cytochrome c-type biogenesis protein CcmH